MPILVYKDFWHQELTNQMQPYYGASCFVPVGVDLPSKTLSLEEIMACHPCMHLQFSIPYNLN